MRAGNLVELTLRLCPLGVIFEISVSVTSGNQWEFGRDRNSPLVAFAGIEPFGGWRSIPVPADAGEIAPLPQTRSVVQEFAIAIRNEYEKVAARVPYKSNRFGRNNVQRKNRVVTIKFVS